MRSSEDRSLVQPLRAKVVPSGERQMGKLAKFRDSIAHLAWPKVGFSQSWSRIFGPDHRYHESLPLVCS